MLSDTQPYRGDILKDLEPPCDDVSESDVYTEDFKNQTTPLAKPHAYNTFSSSEKHQSNGKIDSYDNFYDTQQIKNSKQNVGSKAPLKGRARGESNKLNNQRTVTIPFHKPKFMHNVAKVVKKPSNTFKKFGLKESSICN